MLRYEKDCCKLNASHFHIEKDSAIPSNFRVTYSNLFKFHGINHNSAYFCQQTMIKVSFFCKVCMLKSRLKLNVK